jgi:hypothetical protein
VAASTPNKEYHANEIKGMSCGMSSPLACMAVFPASRTNSLSTSLNP